MYLFFRKLLSIVFHIKYRITLHHEENIAGLKGGYIIASNHLKMLDPPMIASCVRGRFSFMAKEELFHVNPFVTFVIKRCGAFPIVRGAGDNAPIERAVEVLGAGRIFVIFPEGTRSKDGRIGRVKSGVALIAGQAKAPVVPVCLKYSGKRDVDVSFGKPIPAAELAIDGDDRRALRNTSKRIQAELVALWEELNPERVGEEQKDGEH
ncbi:MAG: 1-acyl-sn-glycerol-3-phosphate acyltransferase [Bacteroides sp.]|nr:1-acyl-sn-glycerol-3-phosphate acyltransferase [Eubacterium sp.]MCM1418557.1 1-acyl-sn-glycerol-3-phosphate acyltransferase [Roseburia sp.]MCM1462612.1 1-acyl-sn-glycerol-3-phosphate acyltransferase [Bacteroides sp.]